MSMFRRRDTVRFALSAAVVTHTSTTQMAQTTESHTRTRRCCACSCKQPPQMARDPVSLTAPTLLNFGSGAGSYVSLLRDSAAQVTYVSDYASQMKADTAGRSKGELGEFGFSCNCAAPLNEPRFDLIALESALVLRLNPISPAYT